MITDDYIIHKRGQNIPVRKPLSQEIKQSIMMLILTLLTIIILVSIAYLVNSSKTTQKGYALKQEQIEKDALIERSNNLINQIIEAQSFQNIENSDLVKSMTKPENKIYIE